MKQQCILPQEVKVRISRISQMVCLKSFRRLKWIKVSESSTENSTYINTHNAISRRSVHKTRIIYVTHINLQLNSFEYSLFVLQGYQLMVTYFISELMLLKPKRIWIFLFAFRIWIVCFMFYHKPYDTGKAFYHSRNEYTIILQKRFISEIEFLLSSKMNCN